MSNNSNQKSTISSSINYAEDSVENMTRDITQRFRQLVKQRESLQNAVNILQQEKQEMYFSTINEQRVAASNDFSSQQKILFRTMNSNNNKAVDESL